MTVVRGAAGRVDSERQVPDCAAFNDPLEADWPIEDFAEVSCEAHRGQRIKDRAEQVDVQGYTEGSKHLIYNCAKLAFCRGNGCDWPLSLASC
jgi:hypothetical protein